MKDSAYNLCARDQEGNYYLFNTRHGTAHIMSAGAYERYWAAARSAANFKSSFDHLRELVEKGFLVDDAANETAEVIAEHEKARLSRERIELLIAPSMACNLDCFYCFEANKYARRMDAKIQSNIVRLVRDCFESGARCLDVTWYGGEPLLGFAAIAWLSKAFLTLCDEFGRDYSALIVTNGTMMTSEKARQLAAWKVKRAQITLDGIPELHDRRRVAKNGNPTFCKILDGIEAAAAHMQVSVRINVCREVAAHLEELLQILAARGLNRMVSVYVAPLHKAENQATPSPGDCKTGLAKTASDPEDQQLQTLDSREAADLALTFDDLLEKYGFAVSNRLPEPRRTTCMADRELSWLIEPNGDMQKCYWTAGLRAEAVGRLENGRIIRQPAHRQWDNWTRYRDPACLKCIMLPLCLGRCPLKHLKQGSDYCPPFKHIWIRVLARALGTQDDKLIPLELPLAGEAIRALARTEIATAICARV